MAPRTISIERQYSTIGKLLEHGAKRTSAASFAFDAAGKCANPKYIEVRGAPSGAFGVVPVKFADDAGRRVFHDKTIVVDGPFSQGPLYLDGRVRCRKCGWCKQQRAKDWTLRASTEIKVSVRTWFATLTLRPDRAHYFLECARERRFRAGVDLDADKADERFRQWCHEIGKELQLFMKRVRKNSAADLRHLFVFEPHKSGYPHVHGFIHECSRENSVTKRTLEKAWHLGHSKFRLVQHDAARPAYYITKYLTKDLSAKPRASVHYGRIDRPERLGANVLKTHAEVSKTEGGEQTTQERETASRILTDTKAVNA